jgi:hypothetical protein
MLMICFVIQAQDKPEIQTMHLKKWDFIVRKCKLTPNEIDSVKPVFLKYENALWHLADDHKNVYKTSGSKNTENRSEKEYAELNEKTVNIEMKKAQLFKNYYRKLKTQLSAKTIFNYFEAERAFRRELIKDWQNNRKRNNDNRDQPNTRRPEIRKPEKKPEHR